MLLVAVTGCVTSCYIYEVKVLRKWCDADKSYHYFVGCSDFHDRLNDANGVQRQEILKKLALVDKNRTQILLEDLSSPNNNGIHGCNNYYLTSERGILASLTKECQKLGLPVNNLEYRYCRVISLGGLLNNSDKSAFEVTTAAQVLVGEFINEVAQTVKEIRGYTGNYRLLSWYKTSCNLVEQRIKDYQFEQMKNKSLAAYFEAHASRYGRMAFLKQLLTFDSNLFDCKLLNAVVSATDKTKVIAFAGGTHIERTVKQLEKMGYQSVYCSSLSYHKRNELRKCLGSPALLYGGAAQPKPIAVEILTKYL